MQKVEYKFLRPPEIFVR